MAKLRIPDRKHASSDRLPDGWYAHDRSYSLAALGSRPASLSRSASRYVASAAARVRGYTRAMRTRTARAAVRDPARIKAEARRESASVAFALEKRRAA